MKGCPAHPMQSCRWSSHMEKRMLGCLVIVSLRKGLVCGSEKVYLLNPEGFVCHCGMV